MDEKTIRIPGWRIIRVIGKGSFGKVYEVEKEDEFGGGVRSALKVISIPETSAEIEAYRDDGYDDESITKLFRSRVEDITSEFRLMNRLKGCSNIVSYEDHTVVQHENDIGYDIMIRMELLTPLPKYMDQQAGKGAADENTVRRLGADICRALELCERCHIIHRDIKPQNIFVSDLGDFKLGDFGIAKTSDHTTKATKTGTYAYMAPEVYLSKPYNASVDLYSLGIVLYWMLNERRGPFLPLPPEIPTPAQTAEALERRMHGEPLPAPKHGSEELKRIVLKACAYDPKDRYASPAQMRRDLERALTASAAELPAEQTLAFEEAGEATVGLFAGKEVPIRDENATVRLFEDRKETPKPVPAKKKPEKAVKPAAHTETIAEQEPQQQKKRQKKNVLAVILAAAMLVIAAAIVLVIVLSSKTGAAQKTEAEAVPTLAPTEEPTEAPADEISVVVTPEPEETPEPVSEEELAYSAALALFEEGKYEEAIAAFEALNGYRDSAEQIETCKNERDYTAAVALYDSGEYKKAIPELIKIRDYKDSNTYLLACWDHVAVRDTIAASYHTVALKTDGTVVADNYINYGYGKWYTDDGQCNVSDWTDIIAISAGACHTVGLKADGTVVAVGNNENGQCEVSDWTDIVAISAGDDCTVGLKADGTVVYTPASYDVSDWANIMAIDVSGLHTVGLKLNGTVVAVGWNEYGQCNVSDWTDIVAISAGGTNTVGLKTDGTVIAVGSNLYGERNVSGWTDIVAISSGACTVGLKADGKAVAVGENWNGERDVYLWPSDIVAISAGGRYTLGLRLNGTLVLAGEDHRSQYSALTWTDIKLPNSRWWEDLPDGGLQEAVVTPKPSSKNAAGKVISSKIALRKSPTSNSECIEEYLSGETCTIYKYVKDSSGRKWYYVKMSDGKTGYLYAEYVKVTSGSVSGG